MQTNDNLSRSKVHSTQWNDKLQKASVSFRLQNHRTQSWLLNARTSSENENELSGRCDSNGVTGQLPFSTPWQHKTIDWVWLKRFNDRFACKCIVIKTINSQSIECCYFPANTNYLSAETIHVALVSNWLNNSTCVTNNCFYLFTTDGHTQQPVFDSIAERLCW